MSTRIAADKVLCDKAFNIAKNPSYDRYERGLASLVYEFFSKKSSGNSFKIKFLSNQELAVEIHKLVIRKFEKQKVYSSFKEIFAVLILLIYH